MNVHIEIPDDILDVQNPNIPRKVLEAVAIDGFRSNQLSTAQIRVLLGFETRDQVHEFLHSRGIAWVDYDAAEVERETNLLQELLP